MNQVSKQIDNFSEYLILSNFSSYRPPYNSRIARKAGHFAVDI
jgi:hypothetical protein